MKPNWKRWETSECDTSLVVCIKTRRRCKLVWLVWVCGSSTVSFAILQLLGSLQNDEDGSHGVGNATSHSCNCSKEEKYYSCRTHFNSCLCPALRNSIVLLPLLRFSWKGSSFDIIFFFKTVSAQHAGYGRPEPYLDHPRQRRRSSRRAIFSFKLLLILFWPWKELCDVLGPDSSSLSRLGTRGCSNANSRDV